GGFAQMHFNAQALAPQDFDAWVATTSARTATLDFAEYRALAQPGTIEPLYYGDVAPGLYEQILGQFGDPVEDAGASHGASMQHY
ncbi:MAG TPA: COX aromatic rich motif-containing protein, partial [Candidatus Paceibacterota bacterium]